MLQYSAPLPQPVPVPAPAALPLHYAAKWPPDDGSFDGGGGAAGGGLPGGGGFDPGDGDFKKGKMKPLVALLIVAALGIGGAFFLGVGSQLTAETMTPGQAAAAASRTLTLPVDEQLPQWRKWAGAADDHPLKNEALRQLAWAKDPGGLQIAISALEASEQDVRARAATALAEYGLPAAESARGPLLAALKDATPASKPQIAWALVELGEAGAFEEVMNLYRLGHLSGVQNLEGARAFDPAKIVRLVTLDKLSELHTDDSPAVRQLVATVLSRNAAPKFTEALIALVQDADRSIAAQAAPGLGKIGDSRARGPLLEQLKGVNVEDKKTFLNALANGLGTAGLVLALDSVNTETPTKEWHQTRQIFRMIRTLADPSGGDALAEYLTRRGLHIHWQVEAAMALAEIGDMRAVPTLAARLRMDAQKIYSDETDYEMLLKRNNKERVEAARMLADLAEIHPDQVGVLRDQAESALLFWIREMPSPHANGLRALVNMQSTKILKPLRKWANPRKKLPLEGQPPPMPQEWVVAQSALRYIGKAQDKKSWPVLLRALKQRKPKVDATMSSLMAGGLAVLGMSLRALGVGASQGLSEWGDPKAFAPLMAYIEDPLENEQSRLEACAALAWVAKDEDFLKVAQKISEYSGENREDQIRQSCLLETLITRPIAGTSDALIGLLTEESSFTVRHAVARAIGKAGVGAEVEAQLLAMLQNEKLINDAALALMLGGSEESAARAMASYVGKPPVIVDELQELWYKSFGYWSHRDLDEGHLFRFVANAEAVGRVPLNGVPQGWASEQLRRQFDTLTADNGPHSFTRVVLRRRLLEMALGEDAAYRKGALNTLRFMKERGVLLALRGEEGAVADQAAEAYFRLLNPTVVLGAKQFGEDD